MRREPVAKGMRDGRRSVRATESGREVQIHAVFPTPAQKTWPSFLRSVIQVRLDGATSYTALCLRVQYLCAGASVFTFGGATIPCAAGMAAVCLTSVAVAVICNDRCPP